MKYLIDDLITRQVELTANIDPETSEIRGIDYHRGLFTDTEKNLIDDYISDNFTLLEAAIFEQMQTEREERDITEILEEL